MNSAVPFWFQSADEGGQPPVPPIPTPDIGRSLRFRAGDRVGGMQLFRNVVAAGNRNWTWSGWVKFTGTRTCTLFTPTSNASPAGTSSGFYLNPNGRLWYQTAGTNSADAWRSDGIMADQAAWYHIVFSCNFDDGETIGYINGVQSGTNVVNTNNDQYYTFDGIMGFRLGGSSYNNNAGGDFYCAEVYLVEGVLGPETFGRFNNNGIWVPRAVPTGLGFDAAANPTYSNFLTAQGGGTFNNPATSAFDGLTTTGATLTNSTGFLRFAPAEEITGITRLRVFVDTNVNVDWQGTTTTNTLGAPGWLTVTGTGTISAAQPVDCRSNNTSFANLRAVEIQQTVDGATVTTVLTDPFQWAADLFTQPDTATPNFNTTEQVFLGTSEPPDAFDGNNSTEAATLYSTAQGGNAGTWVIWRPGQTITAQSSVQVTTRFCESIFVNGTDTGLNAPASANLPGTTVDLSPSLTFPITIESIGIRGNSTGTNASEGRVTNFVIDGREYIDSTNPAYGQNGFRLQFADPLDLGRDTSGNNNDFTANDFDTDPVGIFSGNLTAGTTAAYQANQADRTGTVDDAEDAFDGNLSSSAFVDDNSQPCPFMYFNPTTPITGITSLFYRTAGTIEETRINGNVVTIDSTGTGTRWVQINNPPATLTEFAFSCADGFSQLVAIGINGTAANNILVDNTGVEYDSMQDSPTQNYSLLNSLYPYPAAPTITFSGANLVLETAGNAAYAPQAPSTMAIESGTKCYWEVHPTVAATSYPYVGVTVLNPDLTANTVRRDSCYVAADTIGGNFGTTISNTAYTSDTILSFTYDSTNGELTVRYDNAGAQTFTVSGASGVVTPFLAGALGAGGSINYGQQPFLYTPPVGFSGIQTQNLPAAPVQDGRDNFRVVQAAGAAIRECSQGELNDQYGSTGFASGLWWIKDLQNAGQWQFLDSIRGTERSLTCPNSQPESAYAAPAGNSIGYCWQASEAWSSNAGTMFSSGYRNTDAGFSIITFTGSGTTSATFGHGLNTTPTFFFTKNVNNAGNFAFNVWATGITPTENLVLNQNFNDQAANIWANPAADNDTINYGTSAPGAINTSGDEFICYAWAPVSGYSAMGVYDGNSNANGPFIYTSFTPQFVLLKVFDTTNDWTIFDGTKGSAVNPVSGYLTTNTTADESTDLNIDFLSNGFKLRQSSAQINQTNDDYIYMAFGSSPFGGSNILPTPAALQRPQPTPADGRAGVVSNSLRFRAGPILSRTFDVTTAQNQSTFSCWIKVCVEGRENVIVYNGNGAYRIVNVVRNRWEFNPAGANFQTYSDALVRDFSAWYHAVVRQDNGTTTLFVNGQNFGSTNQCSQFFNSTGNNAINLGAVSLNHAESLDGYLADVYFIDDQALDATAFGEYNAQGVWVPRTEANITTTITDGGGYGDHGFKLIMNQSNITFGDTTLLQDQSGNNNDFTMQGFELIDEDSANFDLMVDGPSTNFATWNPLASLAANVSLTDANLRVESVSTQNWSPGYITFGPFRAGQAGRYYFEMNDDDATGVETCNFGVTNTLNIEAPNGFWWDTGNTLSWYPENGQVYRNGTAFTFTAGRGTTGGKAMAIDFENRTVDAYSSGVLVGSLTATTSPLTSGVDYYIVAGTSNTSNTTMPFNFGQQPFRGTVPNGFTSLQCRNLPAAPITDGRTQFRAILGAGQGGFAVYNEGTNVPAVNSAAILTDEIGFASTTFVGATGASFVFDTMEDVVNTQITIIGQTGGFWANTTVQGYVSPDGTQGSWTQVITDQATTSAQNNFVIAARTAAYRYVRLTAINQAASWGTNDGTPILTLAQNTFASGLWWIKNTVSNTNHQLMDTVRGQDAQGDWQAVHSNTAQVQQDYSLTSGENVAWCWNASDTWNSTAGTLASSGVNNQNAGFSIVTYSGNDTSGATVAHNLGAIPECIFIKNLDETAQRDWLVYHASIPQPALQTLRLNQAVEVTASGAATSTAWFDSTEPNATLITLGDSNLTNARDNYIAYCWTSISGYSSFGIYNANDDANGPFVYLGFRPALVILKSVEATAANSPGNWMMATNTLAPNNPVSGEWMRANTSDAENDGQQSFCDLLSNGFKLRSSNWAVNGETNTYVYMAWAQSPFGGNNVQPANAR